LDDGTVQIRERLTIADNAYIPVIDSEIIRPLENQLDAIPFQRILLILVVLGRDYRILFGPRRGRRSVSNDQGEGFVIRSMGREVFV